MSNYIEDEQGFTPPENPIMVVCKNPTMIFDCKVSNLPDSVDVKRFLKTGALVEIDGATGVYKVGDSKPFPATKGLVFGYTGNKLTTNYYFEPIKAATPKPKQKPKLKVEPDS